MQKRFVKTHQEGNIEGANIYVDLLTGVNYLQLFSGFSTCITPLLDSQGKVVITPQQELEKLTKIKD